MRRAYLDHETRRDEREGVREVSDRQAPVVSKHVRGKRPARGSRPAQSWILRGRSSQTLYFYSLPTAWKICQKKKEIEEEKGKGKWKLRGRSTCQVLCSGGAAPRSGPLPPAGAMDGLVCAGPGGRREARGDLFFHSPALARETDT